MENIKRGIIPIIIIGIILVIFLRIDSVKGGIKDNSNCNLVVYGDNIKTNYAPFIENDGIYISVDSISKTIDKNIFYDDIATKIIVTTPTEVLKFKIDENKMSKNMEYSEITTPAKIVNGKPYVNVNLLKSEYNIKTEYNSDTNTIIIDKITTNDVAIKYNMVNVYDSISTKSNVLDVLNKGDKVTVYKDSLDNKRWYKIKTDKGIVGYIVKSTVDLTDNQNDENQDITNTQDNVSNEKISMFWQIGSNLDVLGNSKIDAITTVSPVWYELKNPSGEITSKYNKAYYQKAKSYGYKIWGTINNGINSASYLPSDTSELLKSEENREKFIKNLRDIAVENKLDGVNIDFEAMKDEDRDLYTQLIREMVPILNEKGIKVSVDFYFVKYIDRQRIGEIADYVVLMGYDLKGSWSSESGSISSATEVEKYISSLIDDSKISPKKIILGIPFYTRLWTEKTGNTKPTSEIYSMQDCQDFITNNKLSTVWDEEVGQNYAQLKKGDLTYKLWLEDKDSLKRRIETVNKYNLAGISIWKKGLETSNVWQVIQDNMKK